MNVLGIETSCDETGIALYNTEEGLVADARQPLTKGHGLQARATGERFLTYA